MVQQGLSWYMSLLGVFSSTLLTARFVLTRREITDGGWLALRFWPVELSLMTMSFSLLSYTEQG